MRYIGSLLSAFAVMVFVACGDKDPVSSPPEPAGKLVVTKGKAGGYTGKGAVERAFVGTWRLVSFEGRPEGGGAFFYPLGPDAIGQLMYDRAGNMGVHLLKLDRPRFASGDRRRGTDAEVLAAFDGIIAYFGTYTIDPAKGTVTHHVRGSSFPNWEGGDQVRIYEIEGDHLSLLTPPILVSGQLSVYALVFERVH